MTYKEIVNSVLIRLRETPLSETQSVTTNAYSSLIGEFVNDAKSEIEQAWNWSALRLTLSGVTEPDVFNYELNDSGQNFTLLDAINDTSNWFLQYKTQSDMTNLFLNTDRKTGEPRYFTYNGISADGDTMVDLYPIPDGAYNFHFNVVLRTARFTLDTHELVVPSEPVIMLAYAKAVEERGEDGGIASASAYQTAQRMLSDAISYDAAKHPEETIWYTA